MRGRLFPLRPHLLSGVLKYNNLNITSRHGTLRARLSPTELCRKTAEVPTAQYRSYFRLINSESNVTMEQSSPIEYQLGLEEIRPDVFQNIHRLWKPKGARGIFGGSVISQALMAASFTVDDSFRVHSLHCYFLFAGNPDIPIQYHIERLRDGKSFITRSVEARQNGKVIFCASLSFQTKNNTSRKVLHHQARFPLNVPDPENLQSVTFDNPKPQRLTNENANSTEPIDKEGDPAEWRLISGFTDDSGALNDKDKEPHERRVRVFMRCRGKIVSSKAHAMALSYMSDAYLIGTGLRVNDVNGKGVAMMVSLDHSIYFHDDFRADDWLMYCMRSPWTGDNRILAMGEVFTKDGKLVATCIQEGLLRLKDDADIPPHKL